MTHLSWVCSAVYSSLMYKKNWIQHQRRGPVHSYESCSVVHEAKKQFPHCFCICAAHRVSAVVTFASRVGYIRFSLIWMGNKQFNRAVLLGFWNVIGPNGFNSDSETSHFAEVVTLRKMYLLIYRRLFHNVSLWEKVFLVSVHHVTL